MPIAFGHFVNIKWKRYLEKGTWQCSKSPTSAHHWLGANGNFRCKFCHKKMAQKQVYVETLEELQGIQL